jgi:hypothetical protein
MRALGARGARDLERLTAAPRRLAGGKVYTESTYSSRRTRLTWLGGPSHNG